jgi:hypothetical protein
MSLRLALFMSFAPVIVVVGAQLSLACETQSNDPSDKKGGSNEYKVGAGGDTEDDAVEISIDGVPAVIVPKDGESLHGYYRIREIGTGRIVVKMIAEDGGSENCPSTVSIYVGDGELYSPSEGECGSTEVDVADDELVIDVEGAEIEKWALELEEP